MKKPYFFGQHNKSGQNIVSAHTAWPSFPSLHFVVMALGILRCAHMQMCMEHTHTHIHTEHTPGLAGPRPGAEPLTPHPLTPGPLTLSKHILQEATPREDTGALPRHAGAHLRGVPVGAQALASALRLSFFSSPSAATRLVTFSP